MIYPWKPYRRRRISTAHLLVLTGLDQLLLILKILSTYFAKQATLMRRSTVLSLPPQLAFPGLSFFFFSVKKVDSAEKVTFLLPKRVS
jgi:hypothetical protein